MPETVVVSLDEVRQSRLPPVNLIQPKVKRIRISPPQKPLIKIDMSQYATLSRFKKEIPKISLTREAIQSRLCPQIPGLQPLKISRRVKIVVPTSSQETIRISRQQVDEATRPITIVFDRSKLVGPFLDDNWHGAKCDLNAILENGWLVGDGRGSGAGIYFSVGADNIAREYASTVLIRAKVAWGNIVYWDNGEHIQDYQNWREENDLDDDGDTITQWGEEKGYHSVYWYTNQIPTGAVLLARRTAITGEYLITPRIQIMEVLDVRTGETIYPS